ncbi:MAG: hypothetical protein ACJAX1_000740 [Neolewinella sp.]
MTAGEAKNVDNAVVLARLFNEASGQKAPSKKHGLFISRPLRHLTNVKVIVEFLHCPYFRNRCTRGIK